MRNNGKDDKFKRNLHTVTVGEGGSGYIKNKGNMIKVIKKTNDELSSGLSNKDFGKLYGRLLNENADIKTDIIKERDEFIGLVNNIKDNKVYVMINKEVRGILDIKSLEKSGKTRKNYKKGQLLKVKVVSKKDNNGKILLFFEDQDEKSIKFTKNYEKQKEIQIEKDFTRVKEHAMDATIGSMSNKGKTYLEIVEPLERILDERNREPVNNIKKIVKDLLEKKKKKPKEIFEIFRRAYQKRLLTHGQKDGFGGIKEESDIDGKGFLQLLKLSSFFKNQKGENIKSQIKYLPNGEKEDSGFHRDTGGTENGIALDNTRKFITTGVMQFSHKEAIHKTLFGSRLIFDEHDKKEKNAINEKKPTSSTRILFTVLSELKMIPREHYKQMERFVNFVDKVDSMEYQFGGQFYDVLHKTIFGLQYHLPIEFIYKYFEKPENTGFEILSDDFLKKYKVIKTYRYEGTNKTYNKETSLSEISEEQRKRWEKGCDKANELINNGMVLNETFGGKESSGFFIDLGGKIKDGPKLAENFDHGLIRIYPSGDIYIYNTIKLPTTIAGIKTEGQFLVGNFSIEKIKEILDCFTGRDGTDGSAVKYKILEYLINSKKNHKK